MPTEGKDARRSAASSRRRSQQRRPAAPAATVRLDILAPRGIAGGIARNAAFRLPKQAAIFGRGQSTAGRQRGGNPPGCRHRPPVKASSAPLVG